MKTWVKLYTEITRDPKMLTLTWAQRGIWSALLAMAGEIDDRDGDGAETGAVDTVEYAALRIRCDLPEFQAAIEAFTERGMVDERDGVLYITKYGTRQGRAPSDRPAVVAQRVKRHREKQAAQEPPVTPPCNEDVTSAQRGVTCSDSDTDTDAESEADTETEVGAAPQTAPAPAPTAPATTPREVPKGLTVAGREYFSQFRRSRWATNEQRKQFEDTERDVGSTIMLQAVKWAAANNIAAVPKICSAAAKMKRDDGKPRASPGNGHRPAPNDGVPRGKDAIAAWLAQKEGERGE
jgi:hypothetical protein